MLILGIETATLQVGCALAGHEGVRASFHVAHGRRHVETLVPAVAFVCREAQVEIGEIGAVAVDIGPGLFTGLRVGVAAAKALAQALRVPAVGVSSLDLLAFPVRHTNRLIVCAIDARRSEVYYAFYRHVPGGVQRVSAYRVGSPDELVSELVARGEDCLFVGDGALRYPQILADTQGAEFGGPSTAHPSAAALVELAHPLALREEFVQPWELQPLYLRQSDAEINWERRARADWAAAG
ncbi:MAG TPA: tRNA (adenosine(37)-N6)-threonylcarbamoyltransferase complex dimerization subunit type 1 TsaB [Acidimicrobiales bacterium]|nr:tRNA (adenosine(37)-N6)-threonylcarbamoyltransferase complex dimerization subunit type 1 TsaB [Acidimicrobiales bacterium]